VELRPTSARDLPALHDVFIRAISGVYRPHGFEPPSPPFEVFTGGQRHILETGGAAQVALRDETIVGFASAWSRRDDWFLASLFVAPDAQGAGLGRALLDAVWGESFARRRTITDAIQPVSNALYASRGLVPATPVLVLSGTPTDGTPTLEEGSGDLAPIDAVAYGFDRAADHEYWGRHARRTVWLRDGAAVAYSYAFPGGSIGPVAGLDALAAAAALDSELSKSETSVLLRLPGSSRTLVETALRRGLKLSSTPGLLLLSEAAAPPTALGIAGYMLF
jgi:GNAT superfamily N-acetyltransferase